MPILASTMVLPELIPVTYAKIRAELARPDGEGASVPLVILADDDRRVLVERADPSWRLPRLDVAADQAIWRAALRFSAEQTGGEVELAGWAGAKRVERRESVALTLRASAPTAAGPDRWLMIAEATTVSSAQRDSFIVRAALDQLAPSIGR
jgi:ATP adenylyltransferase